MMPGARPRVRATIASAPFVGRAGWTWFVPARVIARGATLYAEPFAIRSAQTSLLARASGYVTVGETGGPIAADSPVDVTLFSCGGAPIEAA